MRRRGGVADNPVLVGTGAILVMLVMVFISYNANSGLPFVPTYDITADLPNGAALVKGNDVRIGGARVGTVISIKPIHKGDTYHAKVALKLDKNIGPIPVDSLIEVRPKSTIGLKYIQLALGDDDQTIPNGGNLALSQARTATEFEDLLNTFDKRVREGEKRSLQVFGNAFAGRGADLNVAFGEIPELFRNLEPVTRTLASPATQLSKFIEVLARNATDYANAGEAGYEVWVNVDRTMGAFAAASRGIQESLDEAPPTLVATTDAFPSERRYFRQLTTLIEKFQPGAPYLPEVASNMAQITQNGPSGMRKLTRTAPEFDATLQKLGTFAADAQVRLGLNGLKNFVATTDEPMKYVTPSQTTCNYFGLLTRNLASTVSSRDSGIGFLRFSVVVGWPNALARQNAEVGPAGGPASFNNTSGLVGATYDTSNHLQSNGVPSTGQNGVCGPGNEVTKGKNVPAVGLQPSLPKGPALQQPSGIKSGKTTEDTKSVGSVKVRGGK